MSAKVTDAEVAESTAVREAARKKLREILGTGA